MTASGALASDEPSLIARRAGGIIVAMGDDAADLLGREPPGVTVTQPIRCGVVVDPVALGPMLTRAFERAGRRRPRVLALGGPGGELAARSLDAALRSAGASDVSVLPSAVAVASGIGLPLLEPIGALVIDIGAGQLSATVLTAGEVVVRKEATVGGDDVTLRIAAWLRDAHGLDLGQRASEALKVRLAAARPPGDPIRLRCRGREVSTGAPREAEIGQAELVAAIKPWVVALTHLVLDALAATPPELAGDIADRGAILVGGGSRLRFLDEVLRDEIRLPVVTPDAPERAAVQGAAQLLARPAEVRPLTT